MTKRERNGGEAKTRKKPNGKDNAKKEKRGDNPNSEPLRKLFGRFK